MDKNTKIEYYFLPMIDPATGHQSLRGYHFYAKNGKTQPAPYVQDLDYLHHLREVMDIPAEKVDKYGNTSWFSSGSNPTVSQLYNRALGMDLGPFQNEQVRIATKKAVSKLTSDDLSLGADLGEAGSTLGMMSNTITRIAKAYSAIKRGKVTEALHSILGYAPRRRIPRNAPHVPSNLRGKKSIVHSKDLQRRLSSGGLAAANGWLELTYGWKPLISSAYDIARSVSNGLTNTEGQITARASHTHCISQGFDDDLGSMFVRSTGTMTVISRVGVVLHAQVISPVKRKLQAMGLLNPASVAWELVPYSFVVDWFIPVGDWIDSFTSLAGLKVEGSASVKTTGITVWKGHGLSPLYTYNGYSDCSEKIRRFERRVPIVVSPRYSSADVGIKLGATRLTSALALLTQTFLKGK